MNKHTYTIHVEHVFKPRCGKGLQHRNSLMLQEMCLFPSCWVKQEDQCHCYLHATCEATTGRCLAETLETGSLALLNSNKRKIFSLDLFNLPRFHFVYLTSSWPGAVLSPRGCYDKSQILFVQSGFRRHNT